MVIFPLIVTDGGWKDRRKLVFNIGTYSGHLSAPSATWEFAARIVGNSDRRSLSVL